MNLLAVSTAALHAELQRRKDEVARVPERVLRRHLASWERVCAAARVRGLLKVLYTCERIPGDQVEINESVTRENVLWLNAFLRTRDSRKPSERKFTPVQFQQVVPIIATPRERYREIWLLAAQAYEHEAAEMLVVGNRRIARTHRKGLTDSQVVPP